MSLRERHKLQKRQQILDAASALLRKTGSTEFTMRQLAEMADVGLVTLYNLLGSKGGVLYALYNASLEQLGSTQKHVGHGTSENVLSLAGIAAADFASDAAYFRPLLRYLLGVADPDARPRVVLSGLERWMRNIEAARREGIVADNVNVALLARQLLIMFSGTVELWLNEEFDGEGFVAQSLYGSAILVLAHAADAAKPMLRSRIGSLESRLPAELVLSGPDDRTISANRATA